ncbi:MAG: hypothetical protein MUE36_02585 [Acidimicrobiales bacterium]|jgi:hypothetical protein|nr:hypothetical protein [Acidimicrobiales bacterium]
MTPETDLSAERGDDDLAGLDLGELRARRDDAVTTETGLSYLRRLVQGPLDLVRAELEHRAAGDERDLATLVEQLPEVLTETGRGGAGGRLPRSLEPSSVDPEMAAELDRLTQGGALVAELPSATNDALVALAGELDALERRVSDRRQQLHREIDALNGELAERYRSGAATVDGALSSRPE